MDSQFAAIAAEELAAIRDAAKAHGHPFLAYLVDMARREAAAIVKGTTTEPTRPKTRTAAGR